MQLHKKSPHLQQRARDLRQNSTDAEHWLWQHLRNRQLVGKKFCRQVLIGHYIVDFLCREQKLVIEIDGSQHQQSEYDQERTYFLESQGYRVIRYWNNEVLQQGEAVLESIRQELDCNFPLTPGPSPQGERGVNAVENRSLAIQFAELNKIVLEENYEFVIANRTTRDNVILGI